MHPKGEPCQRCKERKEMNRAFTQFAVAVIGMSGLTVAAIISICLEKSEELTFALVTGLVGVTSAAAAWLFRLNGSK
jgi:hypothetical protein